MGKGEIARSEQFLLFPQCFLLKQIIVFPFLHIFAIISLCAAELEEPRIGIRGKGLTQVQPFLKQALVFTCLQYKSFENTVGKEEIACNEQFLLFPQCFVPVWRTFRHLHQI